MCLFHYSLHFFSFVPTSFLPFLVLLRVSFICAYLPRSEGHRLLGLYYFFLFPHGLSNWLDISSCLTNSLGFCPFFLFPRAYCPIFSSFVSIGLLAIISYHVIPWGVYLSYWTFMAYLLYLLPFIVPMDLLVATLATLALLGFYFFSWAFIALPYFYLLLCQWACWLLFLPCWPIGFFYFFLWAFIARLLYFYLLLCVWACWLLFLLHWPVWSFYLFSWAFIAYLLSSCFFHSFHLSSFFTIGLFCYWALCQKWVSIMSFRLFQLLGSKTLGTKCIRTS